MNKLDKLSSFWFGYNMDGVKKQLENSKNDQHDFFGKHASNEYFVGSEKVDQHEKKSWLLNRNIRPYRAASNPTVSNSKEMKLVTQRYSRDTLVSYSSLNDDLYRTDSAITLSSPSIASALHSTMNSQCISVISLEKMRSKHNHQKTNYFYLIQVAPPEILPFQHSLFLTRCHQDFWALHCHLMSSIQNSNRTFPFLESPSSNIRSSCTITQALKTRKHLSIYLKSLLDYPLPPREREILHHFLSPSPKSPRDYSSTIFQSSNPTFTKPAPIFLTDSIGVSHYIDLLIDTPSLEYLYLEASEKLDENISSLYFQDEFGDIVELGSGVLLSQLRLTLDEVILFSCAPI